MYYLNKTNIIDHCVSDVIAWTDHPLDYRLVFWVPLQQKYVIRKPCPNSDQKVIAVRIWNPDMSGWLMVQISRIWKLGRLYTGTKRSPSCIFQSLTGLFSLDLEGMVGTTVGIWILTIWIPETIEYQTF